MDEWPTLNQAKPYMQSKRRSGDVTKHSATSGIARTRATLAIAVVVIAAAVWGVSHTQRSTAERVFEASAAGDRMLTAMLDQETGLRGFALTRQRSFLEPFERGVRDFHTAADDARQLAAEGQRRSIDRIERTADRWRELAEAEVALLARHPQRPLRNHEALRRKRIFDRFRSQSADFASTLTSSRRHKLDQAGLVSVLVILGLAAIFGGFGFTVVERQAKRAIARRDRDREYRRTQAEFAETMQIMRNESEAHDLVKNHLERVIDGGRVTVLNRNNSDNRLYAATPVGDDAALDRKLLDAAPDSCLSVRLGRQYEQGAHVDPLLSCELCGKSAADVVCTPSLVGGEVIGSVLVNHEAPLVPDEDRRLRDTVSQAAPVLANLRNLSLAELRASTDALTGLPNSRAVQDTLKRMIAQATRAQTPVAALLLDLDHFKKINDTYGHGRGDEVLAAAAEAMRSALRGSDFVGRYGGEEFLILLPDTDQAGALRTAESVRAAVSTVKVPTVDRAVTASLGVAVLGDDGVDGESLVRSADRALYAAKSLGRDRVACAGAVPLSLAS
jgi:diguanylate cyclase (GGDEF)-like protein